MLLPYCGAEPTGGCRGAAQAISCGGARDSAVPWPADGSMCRARAVRALLLAGSLVGQRAAAGLDLRQLQRMVSWLLLAVGGWFLWLLWPH